MPATFDHLCVNWRSWIPLCGDQIHRDYQRLLDQTVQRHKDELWPLVATAKGPITGKMMFEWLLEQVQSTPRPNPDLIDLLQRVIGLAHNDETRPLI